MPFGEPATTFQVVTAALLALAVLASVAVMLISAAVLNATARQADRIGQAVAPSCLFRQQQLWCMDKCEQSTEACAALLVEPAAPPRWDALQPDEVSADELAFAVRLVARFEYSLHNSDATALANVGLRLLGYAGSGPARAAVFRDDEQNVAHVVIRGTSGQKDWDADLEYSAEPWRFPPAGACPGGATVHGGAQRLYAAIRADLLRLVAAAACDRVSVAGHSLGGAHAAMAALDIAQNMPDKDVRVCMLAPMRPGNSTFAEAVRAACRATVSFVNLSDVVPAFPPTWVPDTREKTSGCTLYQYVLVPPLVAFNAPQADLVAAHTLQPHLEALLANAVAQVPTDMHRAQPPGA